MRKKLAVILLSLMLAVSGVCTTAFALEDDITGHWSAPYFQSLSAHGVITANGKGQFTPDTKI